MFQLIYSFNQQTSLSALQLLVNNPPQNGSCEIYPKIGTTNTLFTIYCSNWEDQDNIKDYSFYSILISFSFVLIEFLLK